MSSVGAGKARPRPFNNAGTVLVYGGTRDPHDLDAWTKLAGERVDEDLGLVPVLSPAQIAQLPERRVLIIRRATPAAVGTVRLPWRRRDVRRAQRELPGGWMSRIGHEDQIQTVAPQGGEGLADG